MPAGLLQPGLEVGAGPAVLGVDREGQFVAQVGQDPTAPQPARQPGSYRGGEQVGDAGLVDRGEPKRGPCGERAGGRRRARGQVEGVGGGSADGVDVFREAVFQPGGERGEGAVEFGAAAVCATVSAGYRPG